MKTRSFRFAFRLAAGSFAVAATTLLAGCLGQDVELPPVTLTFPVVTGATVPDILKNGDKLTLPLPEVCDLPDLAALEAEVRDAIGPLAGLIDIEKVTLDEMNFSAVSGNFDFLDVLTLTFTKDDESVSLDADLSGQSGITQFLLEPGDDEEVDILNLIPGPDECLQAEIDFTGSIPTESTIYNATMQVSIFAVLRL